MLRSFLLCCFASRVFRRRSQARRAGVRLLVRLLQELVGKRDGVLDHLPRSPVIFCLQGVLGSLVQSEYLRHPLRLVQRVGRSRVQRHNPGGQTGHLGERERCSPLVAPALLHPVIGPEADEKGGTAQINIETPPTTPVTVPSSMSTVSAAGPTCPGTKNTNRDRASSRDKASDPGLLPLTVGTFTATSSLIPRSPQLKLTLYVYTVSLLCVV